MSSIVDQFFICIECKSLKNYYAYTKCLVVVPGIFMCITFAHLLTYDVIAQRVWLCDLKLKWIKYDNDIVLCLW